VNTADGGAPPAILGLSVIPGIRYFGGTTPSVTEIIDDVCVTTWP
jgi:hypothetical protein